MGFKQITNHFEFSKLKFSDRGFLCLKDLLFFLNKKIQKMFFVQKNKIKKNQQKTFFEFFCSKRKVNWFRMHTVPLLITKNSYQAQKTLSGNQTFLDKIIVFVKFIFTLQIQMDLHVQKKKCVAQVGKDILIIIFFVVIFIERMYIKEK